MPPIINVEGRRKAINPVKPSNENKSFEIFAKYSKHPVIIVTQIQTEAKTLGNNFL